MTKNCINKELEFIFGFSKILEKNQFRYIHRGFFSQNIIVDILLVTEKKFLRTEGYIKTRKRVYTLILECLQNITRHQSKFLDEKISQNNFFTLQKKGDRYYITTGNLVQNTEINELINKIDNINESSQDDLIEKYRTKLQAGKISDKGGAGLGFIDMARKSGNKLLYKFKKINTDFSFFYFQIQIAGNPEKLIIDDIENETSLKNIANYHYFLTCKNIVLIYNNSFNELKQSELDNYLQTHLAKSVLSQIKILAKINQFITIDKSNKQLKNTNLFIRDDVSEYTLFSGKLIDRKDTEQLKKKIDHANKTSKEELEGLLKKQKDKNILSEIIDVKAIDKNYWKYNFYSIDNNSVYFILYITVPKK